MRKELLFSLIIPFLFFPDFGHIFAQSAEDQTTILFDRGHYSINFEDLDSLRWQYDRHYQVLIRKAADIPVLSNVVLETEKVQNEVLKKVSCTS